MSNYISKSNLLCRLSMKHSIQYNKTISRNYISFQDLFNDNKYTKPLHNNNDLPRCVKVNGRFISPWSSETEKNFGMVLKWLLNRKQNKLTYPINHEDSLIYPVPINTDKINRKDKPHYTWIGHSTCYYQTNGKYIITDPVWSDRCSPSQYIGPLRSISTPIDVENLLIDIVLISHTHYDHLDMGTVDRIGNKPLWVVPSGVKELLSQRGITNCIELDWWESHVITSPNPEDNIEIIFTPTKHWTSRTLFDKNTCLWGSYIVKSSQSKFFFTGDTAYCDIFKTIGELYGPFDLSAIPIGAYKPRWFMSQVHCDPFEAVKIHQDLKSKQSAAIHWATYPLADEDFAEPALELARCRDELKVQSNEFFTTIPGETYSLTDEVTSDFAKLRPILYDAYKKNYIEVKD